MTLLSDLAVAQADRDKAWAAYLRSAEKAHFTARQDYRTSILISAARTGHGNTNTYTLMSSTLIDTLTELSQAQVEVGKAWAAYHRTAEEAHYAAIAL